MTESVDPAPGPVAPTWAVSTERDWKRDWLAWFLLGSALISLLGIYNVARDLNRPFIGFAAFNRALLPEGEVDANTPAWWPALVGEERLGYGDTLLTIDGRPFYPEARQAIEEAAAAGRLEVVIIAFRNELAPRVEATLPVATFALADFVDLRLPDLITAFSYWLLALLVYRAQPDDRASRAFIILAALMTVTRALYVHSIHYDGSLLTTVVETILQVVLPFTGVVSLYFALEYPVHYRGPLRTVYYVLLVAAAATAVGKVLTRVPAVPEAARVALETWCSASTLIIYTIGITLTFSRFVWLWIRARKTGDLRQARIMRILVLSAVLALPILVSSALTPFLPPEFTRYFPYYLDLRYLLLFIPLGLAYVLIRYQALQTPSRAYYFVMVLCGSALIAAIGDFFWIMGQRNWPESGLRPPFVALFISAFIASLVWSRLTSYEGWFSRLVPEHIQRSTTNATLRVGREIIGASASDNLPERIVNSVRRELSVEAVALWVSGIRDDTLRLEGYAGSPATEALGRALPTELHGPPPLFNVPRTIRLKGPVTPPDWLSDLAASERLEVAVPLQTAEGRVGLLAIARRWDERAFSDRDLEIHELIGQQVTLFLVTARQIEELRRVPEQLAEAQEQQRTAIAGELHDTVQQFLGRLPFYLTIARDSLRSRPDTATEVLNQTIDDAVRSAVDLRDIRSSLAPSQLETGLTASVASLAAYYERRRQFEVKLALSDGLDESTTLVARHAVFRVIQQALDNVEMHSGASTASLDLRRENGRVLFSVEDNGCGFTDEDRQRSQSSGSFGLRSMQARLEAVGGGFSFRSAPGQGTIVYGWVPASDSPR